MADFKQLQNQFADAIRDPSSNNSEFDQRRIKIYQELFFNNVEGFCSSTFPVVKSILGERWPVLIRQFFISHKCETPHFIEISQEFLEFLTTQQSALPQPWLLELAHYEWAELAVNVAEQQKPNDDVQVSDAAMALVYNYPVHGISVENMDEIEPEQTCLVVYQDEDSEVSFLVTDPLSVHLLTVIEQNQGLSVAQLKDYMAAEPLNLSDEHIEHYLQKALPDFYHRGILVPPASEPTD